jgi:hypothetical protein
MHSPKPFLTRFPLKPLRLALALLLVAAVAFTGCKNEEEPVFRQDGHLDFLRKEAGGSMSTLASIKIEVADEPTEMSQGLKYRSSMRDDEGMFFIFPLEGPQSFWMQDTKISLDILYVNNALQIVHIAPNTVPFSEAPIPSQKPARYVVEVNAGFCAERGIRVGDFIQTRPN